MEHKTRSESQEPARIPVLPPGWSEEAAEEVVIAIAPETAGGGFRQSLVSLADSLLEGDTLETWQGRVGGAERELIPDSRALTSCIDRGPHGHDVAERMSLFVSEEELPLATKQWAVVRGSAGLSLTLTCLAVDFDEAADAVGPAVQAWLDSVTGPDGDSVGTSRPASGSAPASGASPTGASPASDGKGAPHGHQD